MISMLRTEKVGKKFALVWRTSENLVFCRFLTKAEKKKGLCRNFLLVANHPIILAIYPQMGKLPRCNKSAGWAQNPEKEK